MSFISVPSIVIFPSSISQNLPARSPIVVFPAPEGPTSAVVVPALIVRVKLFITFALLYANVTFSYFKLSEKCSGKEIFPDFCSFSLKISMIFSIPFRRNERLSESSNSVFSEFRNIVLIRRKRMYTEIVILPFKSIIPPIGMIKSSPVSKRQRNAE